MSSLPEAERESQEIVERKGSFMVELSHKCAVIVRRDLEELLDLTVLPLLDARDGLREAEDTVVEEADETDIAYQATIDREVEKVKTTEKFQDLVKRHEAASSGDICVPPSFHIMYQKIRTQLIMKARKNSVWQIWKESANRGPLTCAEHLLSGKAIKTKKIKIESGRKRS